MNSAELGRVKNRLVMNRTKKKFWIGIIRLSDGEILETHKYEEALKNDFHACMYFKEENDRLTKNGNATYFYVSSDNTGLEFECGKIGNTAWANLCKAVRFEHIQ